MYILTHHPLCPIPTSTIVAFMGSPMYVALPPAKRRYPSHSLLTIIFESVRCIVGVPFLMFTLSRHTKALAYFGYLQLGVEIVNDHSAYCQSTTEGQRLLELLELFLLDFFSWQTIVQKKDRLQADSNSDCQF